MDGFEVVSPYINGENDGTANSINKDLLGSLDMVVTATGNYNVCNAHMLSALKKGAVVWQHRSLSITKLILRSWRQNWRWGRG